jgi:hypothetical protein
MMRLAATTLVAMLSLVAASPAAFGEPRDAILTADQARALEGNALARKTLSMVADQVVEVSGVPRAGSQEALNEIDLWLTPKPGWNGICEATEIRLGFEAIPPAPERDTESPSRVSSLDTAVFYKVRGNVDQNEDQDNPTFAKTCARDRPIEDVYFSAPNGRTAQAAGLILQSVQSQAQRGHFDFDVTCEVASECRRAGTLLTAIGPVMMVSEVTPCLGDRTCLELMVHTHGPCARVLSVRARYPGVGRKGWGLVRVERLRLKREECAGPAG